MRQSISFVSLTLASLLLSCALSPTAEGRSLSQVIYEDCMRVKVMTAQKAEKQPPNPTVVAHYLCTIFAGVCRDEPGSEECKKGPRAIDRDRYGAGPSELFNASKNGNTTIVVGLLDSGFDPNAKLGGPGWTGWTPLMIAAAEGHEAAVQALLDAGAEPNAKNDVGRTPLMFASNYGYASIVTMLLAKGANPNLVPNDDTGWTALMAAAYNGHAAVVSLLLKNGANSSIVDKQGKTALELAEAKDHTEVVKVLRGNGAVR